MEVQVLSPAHFLSVNVETPTHNGPLKGYTPAGVADPKLDLSPIDFSKFQPGVEISAQIEAVNSTGAMLERGTYELTQFVPPPPPPEPPKYRIQVTPGESADWRVEGAKKHIINLEWKLPGDDTFYPVPGYPRESLYHRFLPAMVPHDKLPKGIEVLRLSTKTLDAKDKIIGVGEPEDVTSLLKSKDVPDDDQPDDETPDETDPKKLKKYRWYVSMWTSPRFWFGFALLAIAALLLLQSCNICDFHNWGMPGRSIWDGNVPRTPGARAAHDERMFGTGNHRSVDTTGNRAQGFTENGDVNIYEFPGVTHLEMGGRSRSDSDHAVRNTTLPWPAGFHPTITTNVNVSCLTNVPVGTKVIIDNLPPIAPHTSVQILMPSKANGDTPYDWDVDVYFDDTANCKVAGLVEEHGAQKWVPGDELRWNGHARVVRAYGFESHADLSLPVKFELTRK
jgi:hypothetical protein